MNVNFEIDTVKTLTEEIRKALSSDIEPATLAVKLSLLQNDVKKITNTQRLINKYTVIDE
tara:strand:+ start:185 stop:364 length:180 start_codon:yes stop_codon:yes gene_type:complete